MARPGQQEVDWVGGITDLIIFVVGGFLALVAGVIVLLLIGYGIKVVIYKLLGKEMGVASKSEVQELRRNLWNQFRGRR